MIDSLKLKKKNRIILWSPMLSHVGTIKAVIKTAECLSENNIVYILNIFAQDNLIVNKNCNIQIKNFFFLKKYSSNRLTFKTYNLFFFIFITSTFNFFYKKK